MNAYILILISSLFGTAKSQTFEQCRPSIEVAQAKVDYGSLNAFYSIAKGISDGMQKPMSDQTLKEIYNYIDGGSASGVSAGTVIGDVIKTQAGVIAFFCFGLLIIVVSFVLGITICSMRCCCNKCGAEKAHPPETSSKLPLYFYAAFLVAAFAFILTGIIIFNQSAVSVYASVDGSKPLVEQVILDLNTSLTTGSNAMMCATNQSLTTTFDIIRVGMYAYPNDTIQYFFNITGLTALQNFDMSTLTTLDQAAQDAATAAVLGMAALRTKSNQRCQGDIDVMTTHITETTTPLLVQANIAFTGIAELTTALITQVNINVQPLLDEMNDVLNNEALPALNGAQNGLTTTMSQISQAVDEAMESVANLQNAINTARNDIDTWSGYGPVKASARAAMSLPNAIALLFITIVTIGLIFVIVRKDPPTGSAGTASTAAGWFSVVGFYTVIFLTWLAMAITSISFVGGWAISGVCMPMFEDTTFRIYGLIDSLTFDVTAVDGSVQNITTKQLLTSCYHNQTLFTAFNGTNLINVNMINKKLDLAVYENTLNGQINNADLQIPMNPELMNDVNEQTNKMSDETAYFVNMNKTGFLPSCLDDIPQKSQTAIQELQALTLQLQQLTTQLVILKSAVGQVNTQSQNTPEVKLSVEAHSNQTFATTNDMVNNSTQALVNELSTNTFPCYCLYQVFDNAGSIICDYFGRPVQGAWASAGLAALFFIPVAIVLLCASNWFFPRTGDDRANNLYGEVAPVQSRKKDKRRTETQASAPLDEDPFALPVMTAASAYPLSRPQPMDSRASAAGWAQPSTSAYDRVNNWAATTQPSIGSGLYRNDAPAPTHQPQWNAGTQSQGSGLRRVNEAPKSRGNWDDGEDDDDSVKQWSSSALRRA